MNEKPGRILQALNRVQSVLSDEFDDLTPPDVCFVLSALGYTYLQVFHDKVKDINN